jgi:PAS domain S-box-containing protein
MKPTSFLERLLVERPGLRPGSWGAYLAAAAMVAVATAVRLLLAPLLDGVQFITFFAAVMLAALLCGGAAGMLSIALSALSAWAFIMEPAFAFEHAYAVGLFLVLGSLDVVLISALRASVARGRHLNASLRDGEIRYRMLADNASDLITLGDVERNPLYISPASRRLLGYEPEELSALSPESLVHPDDRETLLRNLRSISAEIPIIKSIQRVRHKNGAYIWLEAILNWIAAGPNGKPKILTVVRDITERKAAEDAAARLQALLNDAITAIDDGIAIYDSEERLIVANSAMSRLCGGPADLLEPGRTFSEVIDRVRTGYGSVNDEAFSVFRSKRTAQFRSADGVPDEYIQPAGAWLEIRDFRTREGGAVSVVSDITALKTTAIELDRARASAEAANIAKSRFLAAASHDLRQPLQTISLLGGILKQKVTDPEAASIIDQLGISLNAMAGMLDTLLEVNQLEAGIVNPVIEDFAIDNLLERLRAELGYHAEAKGLALHVVRSSAIVRSDPRLLEHIVRNLLSNAIKYTNQGKILLGCRRLGSLLRIDVIDTGIGIPQDQMEAIFGEFHQIDNPARDRRRGLGLGLSIVQRLSNLLAHPVKVRSVLGKGSLFSVEVPRHRPS